MFTTRPQRFLMLLTGFLLLALTLCACCGCEAMRQFDYQIAKAINPPPQPVTTQPGSPVTPPAEPPPPFAEIAAGVLALLGYGGLAAYIRSTKRNGNDAIKVLLARIVELEKRQTPA